jgi:hypothetical protein
LTTLGLLTFLIDCADMTTDFIVKINKLGNKLSECYTVLQSSGSAVARPKRAARLHAL